MAKPKDYDEAIAQLEAAKATLAEKKEILKEFKTENKIKRNKPVEDEKLAAKLEKLDEAVTKARDAVDVAKEAAKDLKPRKARVTKYEYPDDCVTDKDKKKYRAKMRRDSKKADDPEGEKPKPEKKKKVVKKPAAEKED